LPENKEMNLQFLDKAERELTQNEDNLRSIQERRTYLVAQLNLLQHGGGASADKNDKVMSPKDRLKYLKSLHTSLISKYSEKHPDVHNAQQEIEALERQLGVGGRQGSENRKLISELRQQLALISEKYSENHPDVIKMKSRIEKLENEIAREAQNPPAYADDDMQADDPEQLGMKLQIEQIDKELEAYKVRRDKLEEKLSSYETRLSATPDLERQYRELLRDYENASLKFRDLKGKELEANVAEELEKKSKGERFSIIEPPMLPEKPIRPNRAAIGIVGVLLAFLLAGAYVVVLELMDHSIRGSHSILAITGVPPLAVIPFIPGVGEVKKKSRVKWIWLGVLLVAGLLGLLLIHYFYTPLDVLWFKILRKLDLQG
jgi:uncharacterized protein involved in exopolysaccharide biosynthesis